MDESVAWTCLLEFGWFAKADERVNRGLSAHLARKWREDGRRDCLALAKKLEPELKKMQQANAARLARSSEK